MTSNPSSLNLALFYHDFNPHTLKQNKKPKVPKISRAYSFNENR